MDQPDITDVDMSTDWQELISRASYADPFEIVNEIFQFLKGAGCCELTADEFVQYFLQEDTDRPLTPCLFGDDPFDLDRRFVLTGSVAEGTSIAHLAKHLGSVSEADIMLVFGQCGPRSPLVAEESADDGFYLVRVRSADEAGETFLETLCELDGKDYYLSPRKTIGYLRSVVGRVFRQCSLKKVDKNCPATTLSFDELKSDHGSHQDVKIDIAPAILTDLRVGTIPDLPWLSDVRKRYVEGLPLLFVPKYKSHRLQWRVSTTLAERWLLADHRCKMILRMMKVIKSCYFPRTRHVKSVSSYHLKTVLLEYFSTASENRWPATWNVNSLPDNVISIYTMFRKDHLKRRSPQLSNFFFKGMNLLREVDPEHPAYDTIRRFLVDRKMFGRKVRRAVVGLVGKSYHEDDVQFEELKFVKCTFRVGEPTFVGRTFKRVKESTKQCVYRRCALFPAGIESGLFEIARSGSVEELAYLFDGQRNINVNCKAADGGMTPLYVAAWHGHWDLVSALLQSGADPRCKTKHFTTALLAAVRRGYYEVVEQLLMAIKKKREVSSNGDHNTDDTDVVDAADVFGETPLIAAAAGGQDADIMIRLLLDNGANVNLRNEEGQTALHVAALHGNEVAVECLLANGANPDLYNSAGSTPLMVASGYRRLGVVRRLLDSGEVDVNRKNEVDGETVLHWASRCGWQDVVKILLECGADANIESLYRRTALLEAIICGHEEVVSLLLKYEADVNTRDSDGNSALYYAVQQEFQPIAELLLRHKADPDLCSHTTKLTPLHVMSAAGKIDMIRLLLQHKAKAGLKNQEGQTAVNLATENQHFDVVNMLNNQYSATDESTEISTGSRYCLLAIYWCGFVVLLLILYALYTSTAGGRPAGGRREL